MMSRHQRVVSRIVTLIALVGLLSDIRTDGMELFQVRLIEQSNDSRLIATSNHNYAMTSPKLATRSWRTVSVNGDQVTLTPLAGQQQVTSRAALGGGEMSFLEGLRDEMAASDGGYSHMSTASSGGLSAGGSFMVSSNTGMAATSSSSAPNPAGSQQTSSLHAGDMSYTVKDDNNFSASRSDFPFNWSRVFFNGDLVTLVYRNGDVIMTPLNFLAPEQLDAVNRTKNEVREMQRTQRQQISQTLQNSMDMVSNVFSDIMGSFPKPPDYQSAVGNMFGSNFPFGPNNSPFSANSGWPFASGGAMAFAGRR